MASPQPQKSASRTTRTARAARPVGGDATHPLWSLVAIDGISVRGFKSHRDAQPIALRHLTLLAGENSGGKSSIVQPLLLLKQTLEATYDPGPLELSGSCYLGDRASDLFWNDGTGETNEARTWSVKLDLEDFAVELRYRLDPSVRGGLVLDTTEVTAKKEKEVVTVATSRGPSAEAMAAYVQLERVGAVRNWLVPDLAHELVARAVPGRCGHELVVAPAAVGGDLAGWPSTVVFPKHIVERMVHLPGLRGNRARVYRLIGAADRFPGPFQEYTAGVLDGWQESGDPRLSGVIEDLARMRLTRDVRIRRVDNTGAEVQIARGVNAEGPSDLVNIADVGFGASQALPIVVALRAAGKDQLVHIEQPELHLHPNAQVAMAELLVAAANRGVRLIVETHSSIILRAVQLAVARSDINREKVALHWVSRDSAGVSKVSTADLHADGSFGDWPVDFADVEMSLDREFIRAAAAFRGGRGGSGRR